MKAAHRSVALCQGCSDATTCSACATDRSAWPRSHWKPSASATAAGSTQPRLPRAAANCERVMRGTSAASRSMRPSEVASSSTVSSPMAAARVEAVMDGCRVASVKPINCITTKLPA
ncbi:hypothetical protein COSO111634_18225 [Corallococcus soli]